MSDVEYRFIEPLPAHAAAFGSAELRGLARVWRERRSELGNEGALDEFRKRLMREWAIETGMIERLYTWDRGVTEVLISQGIDAAIIAHRAGYTKGEAGDVAGLIEDQRSVVEGLYDFVAEGRPLSEHFVRTMHQEMTRRQPTTEAIDASGARVDIPLLRGAYKARPTIGGHEKPRVFGEARGGRAEWVWPEGGGGQNGARSSVGSGAGGGAPVSASRSNSRSRSSFRISAQ